MKFVNMHKSIVFLFLIILFFIYMYKKRIDFVLFRNWKMIGIKTTKHTNLLSLMNE